MLVDGIQLIEGSDIGNLTVASGATFPTSPDLAELFYKTGASAGLYVYNGTDWEVSGGGGGSGSFTVTGDVTGTLDGGTDVLTLAAVYGGSPTIGSGASVPVLTVNTKGLITASAPTSISIAETQIQNNGGILARLGANQTITANWQFDNPIIGATPTIDAHLTTKQYVDSVAAGLDPKASVRAATTGNISLSGTQTVDGVALSIGDRVLVKNQTTASQNGIYVAASGGWARSADFDGAPTAEASSGAFTFVTSGTTQAATGWVLTTADPITVGTTALVWTQFSATGAGTGFAGNILNTTITGGSLNSAISIGQSAPGGLANVLSLVNLGGAVNDQISISFGSNTTFANSFERAWIRAIVPGVAPFGGSLAFGTGLSSVAGAYGNASVVERMRITNTGAISFGSSGTDTGTSGQVLTSQGSTAAPTWTTIAGGGGAAGSLTGTTLASNVVNASLANITPATTTVLALNGGAGVNAVSNGANVSVTGGTGNAANVGGNALLNGGPGSSGGNVLISGGQATSVGGYVAVLTAASGAPVERLRISANGSWSIGGATGTSGQFLVSTGSTTPPAWSSSLPSPTSFTVSNTGSIELHGAQTGTLGAGGNDYFQARVLGGSATAIAGFSWGRNAAIEGWLGILGNANNFYNGTAAGDVMLNVGSGSLRISSGLADRVVFRSTGSWAIAGSTGTAGQVLVSTGATTAPAWQNMVPTQLERTTTFDSNARGKRVAVTAGFTLPSATYVAGDAFSFYNDSASVVTITQGSGLTLRQDGTANTGNRTLAARGSCFVWYNSASEAIISGSVT